jgi:hypothetical protein
MSGNSLNENTPKWSYQNKPWSPKKNKKPWLKGFTRKKVTCSSEPTFLEDDELKTQYFKTLTPEEELIIYTLSMSDSNDISLSSSSSAASSSNNISSSSSANSSKNEAKDTPLPEMKYYRIGPHGMLIALDEELYDLPIRNNNQPSSANVNNANSSTAATASSSKNTANNIATNKIKVVSINETEFKQLYQKKHIFLTTPTFASLLSKSQQKGSKIFLPDEDPLNLLYDSYSLDTLIDKLIKFLPIHYNFDNITPAKNPDDAIKYIYDPNQKPTSLEEEFIKKPNKPNFHAIYGITEFLRSYIDAYHDFLHYGAEMINGLKKTFETSVLQHYLNMVGDDDLKDKLTKFYRTWIKKIDENIFTNTENKRVIQPKCHQLIEELADEYTKLLHDKVDIKWMPTSKTNAFVGTYSLNSDCDIAKLVAQLKADGVHEFYVESANSHIGKSLESHKMRVAMLDVGEWDAGSGYGSFTKRKVNTVIGTRTFTVNPRGNKVEKRSYEVTSAPTITLFGFINVAVDNEYHSINITNMTNNSTVTVNGEKDGYTRLALNRVAATIGLPTIRGQGEPKKLKTTPAAENLSDKQKQSVASLKTWTDFIQIRTFSQLKSNPNIPKMAMVINDKCCETTARMNGLSCVLKNEGSNITYYCYDINSRQIDEPTLLKKQTTLLQVLGNIKKITDYIGQWFNVRIHTLNTIKSLVPDPVLYFSSLLFSGIYQSQRERTLTEIKKLSKKNIDELNDLIKEFPTTVSEWLQSITNSEGIYSDFVNEIGNLRTIINKIIAAGSRDLKDLIEYTDELKQIIVNSLGKLITNEQQLSILVSTTLAFILFKKPRPQKYKTTFVSVIEGMKKNQAKNGNKITTDQIRIMENSSAILSEILETNEIIPIWTVIPSNFNKINISNSQRSNNTSSNTVKSFTDAYLTASKENLSVLSYYQAHDNKMKKDFNYGFEGIYNRAMCMLLEYEELPPNLQSSTLCKKHRNENVNINNNPNGTRKRKVTQQVKNMSQQGGRRLKTRKRSRYNKQK